MDYIEYKLLSSLQKNARINNIELAKKVGLSPSPCLRRVRTLEDKNIITGYSAIIDQNKVDLSVNVFVQVSLEKQSEDQLVIFEQKIQEYEEVMEAYLMTGDADYLLRIVVKDIQTYEHFLKENLTSIPGISSIRSYFSLKQVTRKFNLPIKNPKPLANAIKINAIAINRGLTTSLELMNSITLLIHSTAATSAAAKIKKPIIETVKDNLYLRVYENNLLIFDFIIPDKS